MSDLTESDKKQQWEKVSVQVFPALQLKLRAAFENLYLTPGKTRARTREFLIRWQLELGTNPPSDQAVRNLLYGKRDTSELRIVDGLCHMLLGCSYAEWGQPPTQTKNAPPEASKPPQPIPHCPYRGLFAFQEADAEFFFGREDFIINKLVPAVQNKSIVAVIGSSGSGKSSVVFAGLIPKLRNERGWLIVGSNNPPNELPFRPGDRPFVALATALIPRLYPQIDEIQQIDKINQLADKLRRGRVSLRQVVERMMHKNNASRLLLVADQFEELYTLCQDDQERQQFLDELLEGAKVAPHQSTPDVTLVITLRADFCGQVYSYRPLTDALQDAELILGPMNRQELREAIENPAAKQGVEIEDGLSERLLNDLENQPGTLPLLEFALYQLWEKMKND
ncbi:hypothetical protein SD81_006970 [Tolypothrix campylonemoides VB511288]|nr:hypothetical protein SD81_006970 [Tolypothrix campylonemoides VB511288]